MLVTRKIECTHLAAVQIGVALSCTNKEAYSAVRSGENTILKSYFKVQMMVLKDVNFLPFKIAKQHLVTLLTLNQEI